MFKFLLILQILVSASLVTVILMQRSEGGGLGVGGSSAGLMTARGAADFLTRATTILASLFVILAISLAAIASLHSNASTIDARALGAPARAPVAPLAGGAAPVPSDPLAAAAAQAGNARTDPTGVPLAPVTSAAPAPAPAPSAKK